MLGVELPPFMNPWYLLLDTGFMDAHLGESGGRLTIRVIM